jgi:hypothetical protein
VLFDLVVVELFDDFTQIEPATSATHAQETWEGIIGLLGWKLAMAEKKRKAFAKRFVTLGVVVDLKEIKSGWVELHHKEGRLDDIAAQVAKLRGGMNFRDALSIRGKLAFAEGQSFGRVAALTCRLLSKWVLGSVRKPISCELRASIEGTVCLLREGGPRRIGPRRREAPVIVLTDGACEEDGTTVGGVILCPGESTVECFGAQVDERMVASWKTREDQTQVIGQAEIFPLLVARLTWHHLLRGRRVIYFVDNESARLAMVKAYSPVLPSIELITKCLAFDYREECSSWYARVPTGCNISDAPSRMMLSEALRSLGAKTVRPVFPAGAEPWRVLE